MPLLRAENLYRFYRSETDEVLALRGVSLEVASGELVALLGPSGSGKSTLLACLGGIDDPDGGRVFVGEERLSHRPERVKAALRARFIGFVFQEGNLIDHLTVEENVLLAVGLAVEDAGDPGDVLGSVGLAKRSSAYPCELSGGEAARAALAVAAAKRPPLLLLDEPTAEIDPIAERHVLRSLRALCDAGTAAVLAGHSEAIASWADRVLHLEDGVVVDA
jgi:putative ABC transport system ATP-binding protein